MILGHLNDPTTYAAVLEKLPALARALAWATTKGRNKSPGKHPIEGDMYADVQSPETQSRAVRKFEAHRKFIDLQYCFEGGEIIEWAPEKSLEPMNEYDPDKDVQHFHVTQPPETTLKLGPDTFAIFFPGDAHMPQVFNGHDRKVLKVVVKIPVEMLK